jgi:nucleoside-diphosphate-sugar epimerase
MRTSFNAAVEIAKKVVDESGIKIEMLNSVYESLYEKALLNNDSSVERIFCITGGNGFLGSNLIKTMPVGVKIISPSSKQINLIENIVEFDLLIKSSRISSIVHLANPKIFTSSKALGDTLIMLKNVLDVCRTNKIKITFLSGWEIYSGYNGDEVVADTKLPPNPKGTYGETKWLCESLIKQYARTYGISYQILRTGPIYGVGSQKPKFIYNFIDKARKNLPISTHRYINGRPKLDITNIEDIVSIIWNVLLSEWDGEFNMGSGALISTYEIAEQIRDLTRSKSEINEVMIDDDFGNILMDNSKISELFSWSPKIKIKDGLKRIIENYD